MTKDASPYELFYFLKTRADLTNTLYQAKQELYSLEQQFLDTYAHFKIGDHVRITYEEQQVDVGLPKARNFSTVKGPLRVKDVFISDRITPKDENEGITYLFSEFNPDDTHSARLYPEKTRLSIKPEKIQLISELNASPGEMAGSSTGLLLSNAKSSNFTGPLTRKEKLSSFDDEKKFLPTEDTEKDIETIAKILSKFLPNNIEVNVCLKDNH